MGQSNIAAGATIGSNHNSRSPDGELIAGRGFWPGLCVSLKHNSRFASFTLIAKGDYAHELDIPLPFSLISQSTSNDELLVLPAYWFMYNMYALARNAWKYNDRDKRKDKVQHLEFDYLAPDTINEMMKAIELIEEAVGRHFMTGANGHSSLDQYREKGRQYMHDAHSPAIERLPVTNFENSKRPTVILKASEAWRWYNKLVKLYGTMALANAMEANLDISELLHTPHHNWVNIGGQLVTEKDYQGLIAAIETEEIDGWPSLHERYKQLGGQYQLQKIAHGITVLHKTVGKAENEDFDYEQLFSEAIATKQQLLENVVESRKKDYENPFRKMVYSSEEEMNEVLGAMEENAFIVLEKENLRHFEERLTNVMNAAKHSEVQ